MPYPLLYSLQHCPYAMRARLALWLSGQVVRVRAVKLNNKPAEMLLASSKGTVPVLILNEGHDTERILDESLDIMLWALNTSDPHNLLYAQQSTALAEMLGLIKQNDSVFIDALEKYKHASRYKDLSQLFYRRQCEVFIAELEQRLQHQDYFIGSDASLADYALLPFIRQFAKVDRQWYLQAPYPKVRDWLNRHLQQPLFTKAMTQYPLWIDAGEEGRLGPAAK
ncbi:MAG: glutathione S-transferase [Pseudomonadales bacterium]|nr:glutathione S-transferase [Pseudomonadales bacterium]